ncbi:MAG: sulfatase, partial [Opitutaceae bacterium]
MPLRPLALIPCALLALTVVTAAPAAAPARPNILFVLSDDQSYPFLSCYGDANVRTPNIDRLARDGMRFHRFFTVAPQCVPSRAGYLTGRSAVAARMTRFSAALPRDEVTFLEILRQQGGYHTGIAGRWFHLDGSARGGAAISTIMERHGLRTFADRVDYL